MNDDTLNLGDDREPDTAVLETADHSGRHPLNVGHLVMGLAFAGLIGIWAVIESGDVTGADIRWLLPLPWLLAGAVGLVAMVLSNRAKRRTD